MNTTEPTFGSSTRRVRGPSVLRDVEEILEEMKTPFGQRQGRTRPGPPTEQTIRSGSERPTMTDNVLFFVTTVLQVEGFNLVFPILV